MISYGLVGTKNDLGFALSLLATLIIGAFTAVGEVTIVGFLKAIPAQNIVGWCSGTGIAGISGAGLCLLFKFLELEFKTLCYVLAPLAIVYFINFKHMLTLRAAIEKRITQSTVHQPRSVEVDQQIPVELSRSPSHEPEAAEAAVNEELSFEAVRTVMRVVGQPILNLGLVYFLQYSCTTSFAERAHRHSSLSGDFWHRNAFVLLSFSYQLGVFVSRSSLHFFKFSNVRIITSAQVLNFLLFFSVAKWQWMGIMYQIPLMLSVGITGGFSYVNCLYLVLENKSLRQTHKELAINICGLAIEVGTLAAAFFALFVSNVVITE